VQSEGEKINASGSEHQAKKRKGTGKT